jgi:ferredoxin
VLSMSTATNHMGYRYPELHPGCTGCAACLLVCPDFVFEVFRYATPVEHLVGRQEPPGARAPASGGGAAPTPDAKRAESSGRSEASDGGAAELAAPDEVGAEK